MKLSRTVKVAIADDHILFRTGVAKLIEAYAGSYASYSHTVEAASGGELLDTLKKLSGPEKPDVVLIDLHMPDMDGFETIQKLHQLYPDMRILVLTMRNDEEAIIRSLKLGACGFLTKDIEKETLKEAIDSSIEKGYYYSDLMTRRLVDNIVTEPEGHREPTAGSVTLSEREREFLQHVCSELTYSEIAEKMYLSARTIDGYRNTLFAKLHVTSRVGLALWAIRNGIVPL